MKRKARDDAKNAKREADWETKQRVWKEQEQARAKADAREALFPKLVEALRLLHDYQNGCPLPKYKDEWARAMQLAEKILPEAKKLL